MVIPCEEREFCLNRDCAFKAAKAQGLQCADADDVVQDAFLALLLTQTRPVEIKHATRWLHGHVRIGTAKYRRRLAETPMSLEFDPSDEDVVFAAGHGAPLSSLCEILDDYELQFRPLFTSLQDRGYTSFRNNEAWSLKGNETLYRRAVARIVLRILGKLIARGHLRDGED